MVAPEQLDDAEEIFTSAKCLLPNNMDAFHHW
jgi:hypothetical protein